MEQRRKYISMSVLRGPIHRGIVRVNLLVRWLGLFPTRFWTNLWRDEGRLKADGVYVPKELDVKNWFLAPSDDLRSSNRMELVASEFKVQGLEIDWAVVCWDADLRRKNDSSWEHYTFRGSCWTRSGKEEQKRYLVNAYRVLLTRARQGMVIFVPHGDDPETDKTRDHAFYDGIYSYLLKCGIKELKQGAI